LIVGRLSFTPQADHRLLRTIAFRQSIPTARRRRQAISYAASLTETFRNAASFVARILRGAKPADLPVEQPAVQLVISQGRQAQDSAFLIGAAARAGDPVTDGSRRGCVKLPRNGVVTTTS
jgi:hypothetical protein